MEKKRRKDQGNMVKRYGRSIGHALDGINYAIEKEKNLLFIMASIIVILALCFIFPVSMDELISIVICTGIFMITEMVNTAVEAVTDLVTTEENKLAKIAKDSANGAIFLSLMITIVVVGIIFIPKVIAKF